MRKEKIVFQADAQRDVCNPDENKSQLMRKNDSKARPGEFLVDLRPVLYSRILRLDGEQLIHGDFSALV